VTAVSGYELQLALSCGLRADCLVFNGNGKQSWELSLAARLGCLVNVDSVFDVQHLVDVCRTAVGDDRGARLRVLLRLNPDIDAVSIDRQLSTSASQSELNKYGFQCSASSLSGLN